MTPTSAAALDAWACDPHDGEATPSTVVGRSRFETVRVTPPPPRARLARRGPRVDVRLEQAPLSNAFRLLADAADLSIVIGAGLERPITVDLRRVRPLDAMRVIAEAHDIDLRVVGQTLVARRRGGT